jgi:hypothetical protein
MNNNLAIAFEQLSDEMIISRIPDAPDHIFSRKFEKRMKKIIAGTYEPKIIITHKRNTVKKLTVLLAAALIALLTFAMSVSAVRETIFKFFTQVFATHTVVQADKNSVYPETLDEIYEITKGIEGYRVIQSNETPFDRVIVYDNGQYEIRFTQIIQKYYDNNINSERYEIIPVRIGDNEGIYINMLKQNLEYLSYDNGKYVITFTVYNYNNYPIGQNALIEMAKSVQKVEN